MQNRFLSESRGGETEPPRTINPFPRNLNPTPANPEFSEFPAHWQSTQCFIVVRTGVTRSSTRWHWARLAKQPFWGRSWCHAPNNFHPWETECLNRANYCLRRRSGSEWNQTLGISPKGRKKPQYIHSPRHSDYSKSCRLSCMFFCILAGGLRGQRSMIRAHSLRAKGPRFNPCLSHLPTPQIWLRKTLA